MADPKLHYNKNDLLKDYTSTFRAFMKAVVVGVGGAIIYFFVAVVYLGGWGHTPGSDYVRTFSDRIQYEYKGTKLPSYEDPSILSQPEAKGAH